MPRPAPLTTRPLPVRPEPATRHTLPGPALRPAVSQFVGAAGRAVDHDQLRETEPARLRPRLIQGGLHEALLAQFAGAGDEEEGCAS